MKTCDICGEEAVIRLSGGRKKLNHACVAHVEPQLISMLLDCDRVSVMVIKHKPKKGLPS